ncbi:hypothetical protein [Eikenella sp. Marseille-P7795]|uniref:hypothetical protein n=1 Tax=Eikenella sp. Marseille-P7795 TaxID=2866577 RepID=UPI001CE49C06|nr:hypothetical protein [Eikenella sp. Marseille-P7795]
MFTSRDLGRFLYSLFNVLEILGIVFAIVMAIAASWLFYYLKPQWVKKQIWLMPIPGLLVAVVFFVIPYFQQKEQDEQRQRALQQARAERAAWRKQYYEPAKARFDQLCRNAGEKIYRTAENVDGILLLKVRGDDEKYQDSFYNPLKDQMWEDAAVESESKREKYIEKFLLYSNLSFPRYIYADVLQNSGSPSARWRLPKNLSKPIPQFPQNQKPPPFALYSPPCSPTATATSPTPPSPAGCLKSSAPPAPKA